METFNVRLLYLYKCMSGCLPIYAFYTILFLERGMSVTDVALLMVIWSSFTIIFEIPSAILADRWIRRNMLAIAAMLQGTCFIIWYFSHSFVMFAVGFVFWAAAAAFTSGTEEGLTYDNLKSDGCEEDFAGVYGKARFFASAGTVIGIGSAGILAGFIPIGTIALISAAICFMNAVLVLQIREKNYYSERLDEEEIGFFQTFREAAVFVKGSRIALAAILFSLFFTCLGTYLDEFDALIINDLQLDHIWVSVILTVRFVFIALGDILAPHLQKRISSLRTVFLLNGAACMLLVVFALFWSWLAFPVFGLALMVMAIAEILIIQVIQKEIKEEGRATVMSFYGVGQNLVMIGFCLIYAVLTGAFGLQQIYLILSVYGMAGGLSCWLLFNRIQQVR